MSSVLDRLRRPSRGDPGGPGGPDTVSEAAALESALAGKLRPARWIGWRLRLLVVAALAGCLAVFLIAHALSAAPHVDATWRVDASGRIELVSSSLPQLRDLQGRELRAVAGRDGRQVAVDAILLQRSARWVASDVQRARHRELHESVSTLLRQGPVQLVFADGSRADVAPAPRGLASLGAMFWLMAAFALGLYLVAMVLVLARPSVPNVVYGVMGLSQAGNLGFIAVESTFELAMPSAFAQWNGPLRMAFDLVTASAIVHAATVHPRRLPWGRSIAAASWAAAGTLVALAIADRLSFAWWWTQGLGALLGALAIGLLTWSYRIEPHPYAIVMRRFGVVTLGTWSLLTLAIAAAGHEPGLQHHLAAIGSVIWYVFFGSLLLVVPFLSRSKQVVREFSMLAAVSTVATSLDLLFVAVFSLGQFASLTLALFLAFGVYAAARQWILNQMLGTGMATAERMFEQLYRIAREVEANPAHLPAALMRLLRELFEPLEVLPLDRVTRSPRILGDGSTLVVPVPDLGGVPAADAPRSIAVRFARRGRRLFTQDDARLAARVVEQLEHAVAYDRAVEQGRSEERARLAQDLHDDIGARLLTLMYKAPSPEMEDYVRHTLQDLKTLTRGLAAPSHRLSHAVAEWKADIAQRLAAAQCDLGWAVAFERDVMLSVVQWSALTRVLRELVSNAIAHARASRVDVWITLDGHRLELVVSDDGVGRNPQAWAHGLGLGGVRKRVKQLGGEVEWSENPGRGIRCRVRVPDLNRSA